jgi:hypothetical protein
MAPPRRRAIEICLLAAMVLLNAVLAGRGAQGQEIDFGPEAYVARLLEGLETEIDHFAEIERGATESQRVVIRGSINLRIIAAELLGQGDAAGWEGAVSVLHGLHLAEGRAAIDELLVGIHREHDRRRQVGDIDPQMRDPALVAVRAFNAGAIDRAQELRTLDPATLDAVIAAVFGPLVDAMRAHLGVEPVSHWPVGAGAAGADPAEVLARRAASLAARHEAVALAGSVAAELERVMAFLERGTRHPHLHDAVASGLDRVEDALVVAETLDTITWLGDITRVAYAGHLERAVALYADPATRPDATALLDRLARSAAVMRAIDELSAGGLATRPLVKALRAANRFDEETQAFERPPAALRRLSLVLDRMLEFRAFAAKDSSRSVRPLLERLAKSCRTTQVALLKRLDEVLDATDASADPALVSLMADQLNRLEDLRRVSALPDWIARMSAMNPAVAPALEAKLRKQASLLASPQRRPDALRVFARLEEDVDHFDPMPYERELASGQGAAIELAGGRPADLLAALQDARRAWVAEWSRGESDGPERERLELVRALLAAMELAAGPLGREPDFAALARWAAWKMPAALVGALPSQLETRLKLASIALLDGNGTEVSQQLARIDRLAPAFGFASTVDLAIGDPLRAAPDGAVGVIGRLVHPPAPAAWIPGDRATLAMLSRLTFEIALADAEAQREQATRLRAMERELLAGLQETASARP